MGNEQIVIGVAVLILSAFIYIESKSIAAGTIFAIIGLALILFNKEEDKIEKRRDKK